MSARILAAALAYAGRGLAVFPACAAVKKSHKAAEHSNGARWGATSDPAEIRRDFARWPRARIGIVTGAVSGIVVVDIDTIEGHGIDGSIALGKLEAKHGPLPQTLQAISPSGSIHHYLKHPGGGIKIKGSASELGAGIDIRGDGNMTVAPPSLNLDGRRYRWVNKLPIAPMPAWLIELTRDKPPSISQRAVAGIRRSNRNVTFGRANGYGAAALESEITALVNTAPGGRNHALNRASFSLHQLVAGGELDGGVVRHRLIDASTANGLVADDGLPSVLATIESGMRAGLQYPRSRPTR
jgi:hypothetical protein